jgi:preprotein translocase subunit SecD
VVALNLLSASPNWLTSIHALPMYLGLDLRGGVHFLLQVDMQAALTKRIEGLSGDIRSNLRDKNVRHAGITREGQVLRIRFPRGPARTRAREVISNITNDLELVDRDDGQDLMLVGGAQAAGAEIDPGGRGQAEHRHPEQARQRARCRGAGDPAAG